MRKFIFFITGLFISISATSQTASFELVSSSGESFNNATCQLDWSIGESITATHSAEDYIITQGFHQDDYVITTVEDLQTDINISVFPNPATDFITINLEASLIPSSVLLSDTNGKAILQRKIFDAESKLDFSSYTQGVYFLSIKRENKVIKTFKIIKN